MGVSRSLDEFAVKLEKYAQISSREQIEQMAKSRKRIETALNRAAVEIAGPDKTLSRVGRATGRGKRAGGHLSVRSESADLFSVEFRARGPWQIRDNTVRGGRTASHVIRPRNDRNPRPLPPATHFAPALQFRGGGFEQGAVVHGGSARTDAWRRHVQSTQPIIVALHNQAFRDSLNKVF